jgi:hypothetical protein
VSDPVRDRVPPAAFRVALGLEVERGHEVTVEDAEGIGRDLIRLRP